MKVISKLTGRSGQIPDDKFDPNLFDVVEDKKQGSFLGNVVKSIAQPAIDFGKYVGEAGAQGARVALDPVFRKALTQGTDSLTPEELQHMNSQQTSFLLDENKLKDRGEILKTGAKATAGAASYVVPGGASAKSALALGAVAGGLQGFSQSEDGNEVQDTLGGAAGGAAFGGVTHGAGKLLSKAGGKVANVGEDLRNGIVNPKVAPDPFMAEKEDLISNTVNELTKGSAADRIKQIPDVYRNLTKDIQSKLAQDTRTFKTADIVSQINDSLNVSPMFDEANPAILNAKGNYINLLLKKANSAGENGLSLKAKDIFEFKQELGRLLTKTFDRAEKGATLTEKEMAGLAIWESMDDLMTGIAPDIKELTLTQSYLHRAMPGLKSSRNASGPTMEILGTKFGVPNDTAQAVTDFAGRQAGNVGNIVGGAGDKIQSNASQMIAQQVGGRVGALPLGAGEDNSQQPNDQMPYNPQNNATQNQVPHEPSIPSSSPSQQSGNGMQTMAKGGFTLEQAQKAAEWDLQNNGGKGIAKIQELYNFYNPKEKATDGGKYSESDKKYIAAGDMAQKALELLDSGKATSGKGAAASSGFGKFFGTQDENSTALQFQIDAARTSFKTYLIGAGQTAAEAESLANAIFNYSDEPKVLKQKLRTFISDVDYYKKNLAGGTGDVQTQ